MRKILFLMVVLFVATAVVMLHYEQFLAAISMFVNAILTGIIIVSESYDDNGVLK